MNRMGCRFGCILCYFKFLYLIVKFVVVTIPGIDWNCEVFVGGIKLVSNFNKDSSIRSIPKSSSSSCDCIDSVNSP